MVVVGGHDISPIIISKFIKLMLDKPTIIIPMQSSYLILH